jgi:Protein of unknown function DUF262/Protein of unknown function (DUF1524)
MEAVVLSPRALFDGTICYEVPPFQRPYVWNEEDQWQPLWDDIARVADAVLEAPDNTTAESTSHFLGAVVLKLRDTPAGAVARRHIIDGQQRLTTLQLLLDSAQLVLSEYGDADDAESLQELVLNGANRFRNTASRFKLWPSRVDRDPFERVMDDDLAATDEDGTSPICQAHVFFAGAVRDWAQQSGDDAELVRKRLSALAQVLQQHLQIVAINLAASDDDQLIFETLNDRGTPLLAADLIKNYLFQKCEALGADVDSWSDVYWKDFDEDWWRDQVAQGRLFRSRIDLFLQYWLTMRRREEIPSDAVFARFRSFSDEHLTSQADAEAFLQALRRDADTYRELVTQESGSPPARFYSRVVEAAELGTFIPLLLWLISDNHNVPEEQVELALNGIESMAIRRILLRMTMKGLNNLVVSILRELDGKPVTEVGEVIVGYLGRQTADSMSWPTDGDVRQQLPSVRVYANIKQPRLRVVLAAIELLRRTERHENVSLPEKLELEHVMPRGWRTYWGADIEGDPVRAAQRDDLVHTLGNLTLVTKKLNGTLSNRPWRDEEAAIVAPTGREAGVGKRSLLSRFSILVLNKEIVDPHPDNWTEDDIRERGRELTEAVIAVWPRPASVEATK